MQTINKVIINNLCIQKNNTERNYSVSFSFDKNYIYNDFEVIYGNKRIIGKGFLDVLKDINKFYRKDEIKNYNKNRHARIYIKSDNNLTHKLCDAEVFMNLTNKDTNKNVKVFSLHDKPIKFKENAIVINNFQDYNKYYENLKPIFNFADFIYENIFMSGKDYESNIKSEKYQIDQEFILNPEKIYDCIKLTIIDKMGHVNIESVLSLNGTRGFQTFALLQRLGIKSSSDKYKKIKYYTVDIIWKIFSNYIKLINSRLNKIGLRYQFKEDSLNNLEIEVKQNNNDEEISNSSLKSNDSENDFKEEKHYIRKYRTKQCKFRSKLLAKYNCCPITNISCPELLVASHIKDYAECQTMSEAYDINNGLLLYAGIDILFDNKLISFDSDGNLLPIKYANIIEYDLVFINNLIKNTKINLTKEMEKYMKWHREQYYTK